MTIGQKLRRNDPCPCGSGKKYKQCCLQLDAARHANAHPGFADTLQHAIAHHQAGRLSEAETLYQQILQIEPDHPDALHLLGLLSSQAGKHEIAIELINKAIEAKPAEPVFYNSMGNEWLSLGRLNDAETSYQQAASIKPDYAEAIYNLGVVNQARGKLGEAGACYRQAIKIKPDFSAAHNNLGNVLKDQGRPVDAALSFRQALKVKPELAPAYINLGIVLQAQGLLSEAITCFRQGLQLRPDLAEGYNNLGTALQAQGNLEDALNNYQQALKIKPDYAEAYNNSGYVLKDQGKFEDAIVSINMALQFKPELAEAYNNMGVVLQEQGRFENALASYFHALKLKPDFAETYYNLGSAFKNQNQPVEAIKYCLEAIKIKADYADAYNIFGWAFQALGQLEEAATYYQKSIALKPNNCIRITYELMIPPIMSSKVEMLASRARFEQRLNRLIEDKVMISDPVKEGCDTSFYLAFHGMNDRHIQQKIARLYEQACPDLLYVAPHCTGRKQAGTKIRIGFLSKYISKHSVSLCFNQIVEVLSRSEEFDVTLLSSHDLQVKSAGGMYANFVGTHVHLPGHLSQAQEKVAALELDILVYLDIGMEPLSYFLAFSRLARAQCVLGGHPVTTGIKNLDYYLSSDLAEIANADDHYSEKLVRLPIGVFYFERPVLPVAYKSREELGLPVDGRIYACPMMLQKIHPDFDGAISRILQLDPSGFVVLFQDPTRTTWKELLEKRFMQTIPEEVQNRILFLPWINDYSDFISLNAAADVVLDPFHFGIGSTAIATFSVGTPIVTMPSEFLRGRVGLFYCKLLDVMECVAIDTEDYAQKAVTIASDQSFRERIKAKIFSNNKALFENQQPINDLKDLFFGLI